MNPAAVVAPGGGGGRVDVFYGMPLEIRRGEICTSGNRLVSRYFYPAKGYTTPPDPSSPSALWGGDATPVLADAMDWPPEAVCPRAHAFAMPGVYVVSATYWRGRLHLAATQGACAESGTPGPGTALYAAYVPADEPDSFPREPGPDWWGEVAGVCREGDWAGRCTETCLAEYLPEWRCEPFDWTTGWRFPEGCTTGPWEEPYSPGSCCEILYPEYDIRYSILTGCFYDPSYRGLPEAMWYGGLGRNRISTGEWLSPIDLRLVNPGEPSP